MPLPTALRKLLCCAPREHDEDAAAPMRQAPEPVADETVQPGRPYQDYVENETERYWQEMVKVGSLTKPDQQEVSAGALPILIQALRNRPGWKLNPALNRAHMAANAVQLHLVESGRLGHPFTLTEACPNFIEALIQLGHDSGWLAREIPLPDHPAPKHPPIYYTIDPATRRPVPTEDSLIRGDYVHTVAGTRLSEADYIQPWRGTGALTSLGDLTSRGWSMCYSLDKAGDTTEITFHWIMYSFDTPSLLISLLVEGLHFSPCPPSPDW